MIRFSKSGALVWWQLEETLVQEVASLNPITGWISFTSTCWKIVFIFEKTVNDQKRPGMAHLKLCKKLSSVYKWFVVILVL